jgi:hypothetical protein
LLFFVVVAAVVEGDDSSLDKWRTVLHLLYEEVEDRKAVARR